MQDIPFDLLISQKQKSSYPLYALKNMELVSIDKNNSIPIGTFSYSFTQLPSDIDMFEYVVDGDSEDSIVRFFEMSIKKMVNHISRQLYYWILEVKVGIDQRYNFKVSEIGAEDRIEQLHKDGLLTDEDIEEMYTEEHANEILRKYSVLRWLPEEIIVGYKSLPGQKIISLNEAIRDKSQINIEIIGLINGKFTDLSNFFVLVYTDNSGKKHVVNADQQLLTNFGDFFTKQLRANIKKLYFSPLHHDYYKLIKRYWSYGKFTRDKSLIEKMLPIVNSTIGLAGQKKSELMTLIKLIKHTKLNRIPRDTLVNQISNIKLSVASILGLGKNAINQINTYIDQAIDVNSDANNMINNLYEAHDILKKFASDKALMYLQSVGLVPPPQKYIL